MGMTIKKAVWLSFDLGIGGDYPGLYKWLDDHNAIECGDSLAFFTYTIDRAQVLNLVPTIKKSIEETVKLRGGDRIYIIRLEASSGSCLVKGDFMVGKRKGSPWEGYGDKGPVNSEEGE